MNKIQKFIEDNCLDLEGINDTATSIDSGVNGTLIIIAGFACHLGLETYTEVSEQVEEDGLYDLTSVISTELERVFDYAENNGYDIWWQTTEAHDQYIF